MSFEPRWQNVRLQEPFVAFSPQLWQSVDEELHAIDVRDGQLFQFVEIVFSPNHGQAGPHHFAVSLPRDALVRIRPWQKILARCVVVINFRLFNFHKMSLL
jgi:hypothetical protein